MPILTLGLGLVIGFLAQKSGFCSIGGTRDLLMFKQTRVFFGYMALIASAFVSYLLFSFVASAAFPSFPQAITSVEAGNSAFTPVPGAPGGLAVTGYVILALVGGFGMGFLGVLLGGCPLRQMVMGSEGNKRSWFFVVGLCVGAVLFHGFVAGWVVDAFVAMGLGA